MKLPGWTFSFLLLVASAAFAQQVQTSKSTLTLPALGAAPSQNTLRQAKAIVEIALGELGPDAAALEKEEAALNKETAAYEERRKAEQAAFDEIKRKYDARLAAYEAVVTPLTAEIVAFNALPPTQRDAGTLSQLQRRRADAETERAGLEVEKAAGERSKAEGEARLERIRGPLQMKLDRLQAKLGLAYRQLKLCTDYATKVNTMLKTRFNEAEVYSPVLDGAMEQLKKLAGRGFDTP
jgi:DNA repair exonuclease SbcCD ATPase subunit